MSETNGSLQAYLEENPRMIGILFTILLALSQVGTAAAGGQGSAIV